MLGIFLRVSELLELFSFQNDFGGILLSWLWLAIYELIPCCLGIVCPCTLTTMHCLAWKRELFCMQQVIVLTRKYLSEQNILAAISSLWKPLVKSGTDSSPPPTKFHSHDSQLYTGSSSLRDKDSEAQPYY